MKPIYLIYLQSVRKSNSRLAKDFSRSVSELRLHPTGIVG